MQLPQWTRDADAMKRDLDAYGYCLIKDALSADKLAEARKRLVEQAEGERKAGVGTFDDGRLHTISNDPTMRVNQRVLLLLNKGRIFCEIAARADALDLVRHVIGRQIRVHIISANIVRAGGEEMGLHTDQWFVPSALGYDEPPMRPGSITRANPGQRPTPAPALTPAVICNVMWMLSDFTEQNGATYIVPGSHKSGRCPNDADRKHQIQVIGPAGSAFVFDGRLFHGTGPHLSKDPADERLGLTCAYMPPMFKPHENYPQVLRPEVYEEASDELLDLMGFTNIAGGRVTRTTPVVGELRP